MYSVTLQRNHYNDRCGAPKKGGNCKDKNKIMEEQIKLIKKVSVIDTMRCMPLGVAWEVPTRIATYNTIKSAQHRLKGEGLSYIVSQRGIDVTVTRVQ